MFFIYFTYFELFVISYSLLCVFWICHQKPHAQHNYFKHLWSTGLQSIHHQLLRRSSMWSSFSRAYHSVNFSVLHFWKCKSALRWDNLVCSVYIRPVIALANCSRQFYIVWGRSFCPSVPVTDFLQYTESWWKVMLRCFIRTSCWKFEYRLTVIICFLKSGCLSASVNHLM